VAARDGWPALFAAAFRRSSNAMTLVDGERRHVDVNGAFARLLGYPPGQLIGRPIWEIVVDGPLLSPQEWAAALAVGRFTGRTDLVCASGATVSVQWGAEAVVATDRRLVLFVALSTSRWGSRFRRDAAPAAGGVLSAPEREIVELIALGHSGREIAQELHIAHDTVRTHVRNAMGKLGARSRAHLVAKALAAGQIGA
jgi:PAS domain S-box-containing protein